MQPHSGAATGLTVITGNHHMELGKFYRAISEKEKPLNFDSDVIVESDVWIGAKVTLLSGVRVRRGCTIATGAVVTKSTPPYVVMGGVPAKPLKRKWSIDEILKHEEILYSPEERYSRAELEEMLVNVK